MTVFLVYGLRRLQVQLVVLSYADDVSDLRGGLHRWRNFEQYCT